MFPERYFPDRYFVKEYFPPVPYTRAATSELSDTITVNEMFRKPRQRRSRHVGRARERLYERK